MRNKPLPGLAKLPCGCVGKCSCSPLTKKSGKDSRTSIVELQKGIHKREDEREKKNKERTDKIFGRN